MPWFNCCRAGQWIKRCEFKSQLKTICYLFIFCSLFVQSQRSEIKVFSEAGISFISFHYLWNLWRRNEINWNTSLLWYQKIISARCSLGVSFMRRAITPTCCDIFKFVICYSVYWNYSVEDKLVEMLWLTGLKSPVHFSMALSSLKLTSSFFVLTCLKHCIGKTRCHCYKRDARWRSQNFRLAERSCMAHFSDLTFEGQQCWSCTSYVECFFRNLIGGIRDTRDTLALLSFVRRLMIFLHSDTVGLHA